MFWSRADGIYQATPCVKGLFILYTIPTVMAFRPGAGPLEIAVIQPVTSSSWEELTKLGILELWVSQLDFLGSGKVDIPAEAFPALGTFLVSSSPLHILLTVAELRLRSVPQWSIRWVSFWVCFSIFMKRVGTHLWDCWCSRAWLKWFWKWGGLGWWAKNPRQTQTTSPSLVSLGNHTRNKIK